MLGSMGTKGGIIFYHIRYGGYGTTLRCHAISGVTGCRQPKCWLTSVGLVTKPSCGWICCIGIPTCVISVFNITSYRNVLNYFLISHLIYHPQRENSWTHFQPIDNLHRLM